MCNNENEDMGMHHNSFLWRSYVLVDVLTAIFYCNSGMGIDVHKAAVNGGAYYPICMYL